ncbi:MAG: thioredoxin-disulfide reductase [Deltaproteobacteria bacterium]|nr:thioredoxin-disulfide reductase [Deltaproteobacteria bacterium]
MEKVENVIIIGSGPAGHTAAIYSGRANLAPLMFEGFQAGGVPGGQLMITTEVENYPGFPEGVSGPDLMAALRKQSERYGTRILTQDVEAVDLSRQPFKVVAEGKEHFGRALIIATGASARYLGLDSEQRLMNRGVSACATCDGALPVFRNKELVVVGGGDTAMEEASFLTRFASKVTVVHRRDELRASKVMAERVRHNPKVAFMLNTVIEEIVGKEQVAAVRLHNLATQKVEEKPVAGVFIAIGHTPNTGLFKGQLQLNPQGYVETRGKSTYTSVDGVFACGDVQDPTYRQAVSAAGSGCQAAIDAERWLEAHAH